ncbi:MAG: hypothetical protein M3Y85_06485 [Bacteroidota bacterium]|nr:hypothetical protein [Bacteroidota bacterium]
MSLNNISLPPQLLVSLYKNSLVESNARPMPQKTPVSYLGANQKKILILVNHKSVTFLPEKELAFLTTVLAACQLQLSDVAIVNWCKAEEQDDTVIHQLTPKEILFLDVLPEAVGFLPAAAYVLKKKGTIQYVYAPSLSQIEKNKKAKSQLWVTLKQLFCL